MWLFVDHIISDLQDDCRQIQVCVVKTLQLLDKDKNDNEITSNLEHAANKGSGIAAFMLWAQMKSKLSVRESHIYVK